jgi:glycosyltransferase involved in cell wall biosynthesis
MFGFYAYASQRPNNGLNKISVQYDKNTLRNKLTYDVPFDEWGHKFSIYTLKDVYVEPNIKIIKNKMVNDHPKISVVMAYYNRKEQLKYTLKTIGKSQFKNVEVIIVDDNSVSEHNVEDIINDFNFKIVLVKLNEEYKKNKNYKNPGIPYNIGFDLAIGEIAVIQNPECCHHCDILNYVNLNLTESEYYDFSCLSLENDTITKEYRNNQNVASYISIRKNWYNHPNYRPVHYHFVCAMYKKKLTELTGFSNMLGFGYWYDDDEFVFRIKKKLSIRTIHNKNNIPYAIHQWHYHFTQNSKDFEKLRIKNEKLYNISKKY